jgi:hypothetical protein
MKILARTVFVKKNGTSTGGHGKNLARARVAAQLIGHGYFWRSPGADGARLGRIHTPFLRQDQRWQRTVEAH